MAPRGPGTFPRLLLKSVSLCLLCTRVTSVKPQTWLPDPKCDRDSGALKTVEQHFVQDRRAHVVNPSSHHSPYCTVLQPHGLFLYFLKTCQLVPAGGYFYLLFLWPGKTLPKYIMFLGVKPHFKCRFLGEASFDQYKDTVPQTLSRPLNYTFPQLSCWFPWFYLKYYTSYQMAGNSLFSLWHLDCWEPSTCLLSICSVRRWNQHRALLFSNLQNLFP